MFYSSILLSHASVTVHQHVNRCSQMEFCHHSKVTPVLFLLWHVKRSAVKKACGGLSRRCFSSHPLRSVSHPCNQKQRCSFHSILVCHPSDVSQNCIDPWWVVLGFVFTVSTQMSTQKETHRAGPRANQWGCYMHGRSWLSVSEGMQVQFRLFTHSARESESPEEGRTWWFLALIKTSELNLKRERCTLLDNL